MIAISLSSTTNTLIETAKLNDVDARARLADVLSRIADHPASSIDELLFPGGIAASGSKAGSRYNFLFASTNDPFCPELVSHPNVKTELPDDTKSVMEIIINGQSLEAVSEATQAAIRAASDVDGLIKITAGNYDGRLGKSWVWLLPENHTASV